MATTTTNYGFNIADGSDTVNLLTQCYPNFTSLDSILYPIEQSGTTAATATKVGTVHQIVRVNSKCAMLRFVATANYAAGDTFTVDGASVTATSVSGESLPAGAFVINQSVLAILNGSVLTVLAGGVSTFAASDVTYNNTVSGLTATDVQAAIDEVVSAIPTSLDADDVTYDNSVSGLTATDVQTAIDEIALGGGGGGTDHGIYELWDNPDKASAFGAQTITFTSDKTFDSFVFVMDPADEAYTAAAWLDVPAELVNTTFPTNGLQFVVYYYSTNYSNSHRALLNFTKVGNTYSVQFGAGYIANASNNLGCRPMRILGLVHNT